MNETLILGDVAQARRDVEQAEAVVAAMTERHAAERKDAQRHATDMNSRYSAVVSGTALGDYDNATAILRIVSRDGAGTLRGDDARAIDEVIHELATDGGLRLRAEFASTKNYDRWYHQHVGWTPYGMGPRHGETVFSIGFRDRRRADLEPAEIDSCIRLLEAIRTGSVAVPQS